MVAVAGGTVQVRGAKELAATLRRMGDRQLLKELSTANREIADMIVEKARARASTRQEVSAAGRLKAGRSAARSTITLGGTVPYDLGAEFGAIQNAPRQTARGIVAGWNQFQPWRGNKEGAGYFLFPTIREEREAIIEKYAAQIDSIWNQEKG